MGGSTEGIQVHTQKYPTHRARTAAEQRALESLRRSTLGVVKWQQALEHVGRMPALSADRYAPTADILQKHGRRGASFLPWAESDSHFELRPAQNPAPHASFGFQGIFVELSGKSTFAPGTLLLRFDTPRHSSVPEETLRMFRWDSTARAFRCLPVSGIFGDYRLVWSLIPGPGVYGLIGINADPRVVRTLITFATYSRLMERLSPKEAAALQSRICGLILCPPPGELSIGMDVSEGMIQEQIDAGWPPLPPPPEGNLPSPGDLCQQCLGFTFPVWEQVPEVQIVKNLGLHAICIGSPFKCPRPQPLTWESVGPTNVGGYTLDIALSPSGDAVYAATLNGGVWKLEWQNFVAPYTALKFSWKPLTDQMDLLGLRVNAVAVAPAPLGDVYMIDGFTHLYQSKDGGKQWQLTSQSTYGTQHTQFPNPRLTDIQRIAVDPTQPTRVLVASSLGLFDYRPGQQVVKLRSDVVTDVTFDPGDPSKPYIAVMGQGVLRWNPTTNAWDTLLSLAAAATLAGVAVGNPVINIALGAQRTAQNRTIAARFSARATAGGNVIDVFVNRSSGTGTWTHCPPVGVLNEGLRVKGIAIDPFDDDIMLVGAEGIARTTDGGQNWSGVSGFTHGDQHQFVFDPNRAGVVYTATDGGVYLSTDHGGTWQGINDGFVGGQMFYLAISGARLAGTFDDWGVIATDDVANTNWSQLDGGWSEAIPSRGDAHGRNRFYYLGGTILRRDVAPDTYNNNYATFAPTLGFAMDPTPGSEVVLAADQAGLLHRATDGDIAAPTWQSETGITLNPGEQIVAIKIVPGGTTRQAFAISSSGRVFQNSDVSAGRASPSSWTLAGTWKAGVLGLEVDNSFVIPHLYAWNATDIAVSKSGGLLWDSILGSGNTALPSGEIKQTLLRSGGTVLVAALVAGGVFESVDYGKNWYPLAQGLPKGLLTAMAPYGKDLLVTMFGRGLWRLEL
jgi:hypothetical protein